MPKKRQAIPLHELPTEFGQGMTIATLSVDGLPDVNELARPHRDNWHLFFLQEAGTTTLEIDFETYQVEPGTIVYIHPSQVHRLLAFERATISSWGILPQELKPDYLRLLEDLLPVKPLALAEEAFAIIAETIALSQKLIARRHEALYRAQLQDSSNLLVALVASQLVGCAQSASAFSRADQLANAFRVALERDFARVKSPREYASQLAVSTPYLNECVKRTTGRSVSQHIQQRIVLEAQRLLYHSAHSVKEIAAGLGYEDYGYFGRLFARATGLTPAAWRRKNRE